MATVNITPMACGHVKITIIEGVKTFELMTTKAELKAVFSGSDEDIRTVVIRNLITFVRESGLTNWADIKAAVESKEFKV